MTSFLSPKVHNGQEVADMAPKINTLNMRRTWKHYRLLKEHME